MIYSPKQLADTMLLIRQKNGWSQSEIARRVGVKQATISNFENHPDKTTLTTFFKLLQAMELTLTVAEKKSALQSTESLDEDW